MRLTNVVMCILLLTLLLGACKKKDILKGYDKEELFAVPKQDEIQKVLDDWKVKDLSVTDYSVVQQVEILQGRFTLKIVSYKLGNIKEYGALLIPKTDSTVPVRIFVGGFGLGQSMNSVSMAFDTATTMRPSILAIPALRGQFLELTINGAVYTTPVSEGTHCDAFDGGTDDVLALLNLIEQTEPLADANRTSVRGGSRGGTVALLAGVRDKRVKRVVGIVGPTDMLTLTSQNVDDATYQCQFLSDLTDGRATLVDTRYKMIASSPLYFAQHLPLTQLHMGLNDKNVPVEQGYALDQKMRQLGLGDKFSLYIYERSHTDIAKNNPELADRIEQFLSQL